MSRPAVDCCRWMIVMQSMEQRAGDVTVSICLAMAAGMRAIDVPASREEISVVRYLVSLLQRKDVWKGLPLFGCVRGEASQHFYSSPYNKAWDICLIMKNFYLSFFIGTKIFILPIKHNSLKTIPFHPLLFCSFWLLYLFLSLISLCRHFVLSILLWIWSFSAVLLLLKGKVWIFVDRLRADSI